MLVHCWVRPRRGGGYIAECLELGIYYVEDTFDTAKDTLDEAIAVYQDAVKHFKNAKQNIRPGRVIGY